MQGSDGRRHERRVEIQQLSRYAPAQKKIRPREYGRMQGSDGRRHERRVEIQQLKPLCAGEVPPENWFFSAYMQV